MLFGGKVYTSAKALDDAFKTAGVNPLSNDFLMKMVLEEAEYRRAMEERHGAAAYARSLAALQGQRQSVDSDALLRTMRGAISHNAAAQGPSEAVRKAKEALYARRRQREAEEAARRQQEGTPAAELSSDTDSAARVSEAEDGVLRVRQSPPVLRERSPEPSGGRASAAAAQEASRPVCSPAARDDSSSSRSQSPAGKKRKRQRSRKPKARRPQNRRRSPTPASEVSVQTVSDGSGGAAGGVAPQRKRGRPAHPGRQEKSAANSLLFDDHGFVVIDPLGEHSHVLNGDSDAALALNYDPLANFEDRWLHEMYDSADEARKERERRARRRHRSPPRRRREREDRDRRDVWAEQESARRETKERAAAAEREREEERQRVLAEAQREREQARQRKRQAIEADRALLSFQEPEE
eukprot:EG_transcript_11928